MESMHAGIVSIRNLEDKKCRQLRKGGSMVIRIKRLFHGFATVRDYQVEACIKNKQAMTIEFDGQSMVIPWNTLETGYKNTEIFKSKHTNKFYCLIDFDWKPTRQQIALF